MSGDEDRCDARPETVHELEPFDAYCPHCRYNVRGIVTPAGARCPECGSVLPFHRLKFDSRSTVFPKRHISRPIDPARVRWSAGETIVVTIAMIALAAIYVLAPRPIQWWLLVVLLGPIALWNQIAHWLICRWRQWQLERYERRRIEARLRRQ